MARGRDSEHIVNIGGSQAASQNVALDAETRSVAFGASRGLNWKRYGHYAYGEGC
jgi:hypothetical protein